ncbi:MAG: PAS domain-containing protein, partial [Clostridia bacterium]|nr:PAS domain-containing protein [Clostridia bacterium]
MDKKVFSSKLRIEQVVLVVCIIMLLAIILQSGITGLLAKSNVEKSGTMLLNQIESVINDNSSREDSHTEELKETYVSYAKTIAYILALNPDAVYDITELKNIAELQHVDEVHIFDTEGTIISGTEPKYYGYSFDSGEQMGFFKPMLNDKNLTLAQDIMPNTAEGKSMMYTMVWSPDNNFMVEVGVEPHRFLSEVEENSIENVIRHIPVVPGYDIYAVDLSTYEIVSSTNELVLDSSLISGFAGSMSYDESGSNFGRIRHKGEEYYASYRKIGNYMIATVYSMNESSVSRFVPVVIMALFMGLAGLVIFRLFSRLYKVNEEEARQVQLIREYSRTMSSAGFGMWHIILKDGEAPRMQVNGKMAELLGIEPSGMTEEQIYDSWYERVSPEALDSVSKSVEEMLSGHFSENTYRWNHPEKGLIDVRCGGTSEKKDDDSFVLSGYHADVTNLVIEEQNQKTALSEAKEAAEAADKAKSAFLFN